MRQIVLTRSVHESETFNVEDEIIRKRTERSAVVHDENHEPMMVTKADLDFRIPGLPHSVVKQLQERQHSRIDSE